MTKDEMLLDLEKTTIFSYARNKLIMDELLKRGIRLELAYKICKKQIGNVVISYLEWYERFRNDSGY